MIRSYRGLNVMGTEAPATLPSVRISDVVRPFSGDADVMQWLTKLEIVAKLRGIKDLASVLPLFLEGPAFSVYSEMKEADKESITAIKRTLTDAFSLNAFQAYEQLTRRRWREEPVDVYLSDLRRLAKLAEVESDSLLRRAFVVGLPVSVSRELKALAKVDEMPLSSIVERARALMAERDPEEFVAVSARGAGLTTRERRTENRATARRLRCFRCGGQHHIKNCSSASKPTCWSCGDEGHLARDCSTVSGNGVGKVGAPAAFPRAS